MCLHPQPTVLSLEVLYLVFLECLPCALAVPSCKQNEYLVGTKCCSKCRPGYRVGQACGKYTDTQCVPCTRGTYNTDLNKMDTCLPCQSCDPDRHQVIRRKCFSMSNTVCGCDQGHFCVTEDGDECAECRPHSICRPGQRVQMRGTERQDTVCEDCPPGTFSTNLTLPECQPWTKCSGWLQIEATPGTNSTDVVCSSWTPWFLLLLLLIAVVLFLIFICRRHRTGSCGGPFQKRFPQWKGWQEDGDTSAIQTVQVSQVLPDVIMVAMEETASMFPKRD